MLSTHTSLASGLGHSVTRGCREAPSARHPAFPCSRQSWGTGSLTRGSRAASWGAGDCPPSEVSPSDLRVTEGRGCLGTSQQLPLNSAMLLSTTGPPHVLFHPQHTPSVLPYVRPSFPSVSQHRDNQPLPEGVRSPVLSVSRQDARRSTPYSGCRPSTWPSGGTLGS